MDDLLDDVTGLVCFCLLSESDESSDDVSNKSFEDNEDEELDEISIQFCTVWTRSCSLIVSL